MRCQTSSSAERGEARRPCSPRAARAPSGTRQPSVMRTHAGPAWLLVGQPEREDARGERGEDPEQQRPVARVAERAVVAPVVDVVADVPEAAEHGAEQADRRDRHRAAPPSPARGRPSRRRPRRGSSTCGAARCGGRAPAAITAAVPPKYTEKRATSWPTGAPPAEVAAAAITPAPARTRRGRSGGCAATAAR